ncbi:MAG TPA: LacI family DNA-binding transcriptional regulator, partial [Caldilineaceae bacterium]|nr:LacI family DNA-binding transcriptional regulator [Caldilineaceae bacterium]
VLNNGPRSVASTTRARVEAAVAELGYYPNELARSLRLRQSSTIGLIIPSTTNPVYAEIARDLENVCTQAGFLVLLCNSERKHEREEKFVHMLRAKHVDGVVITPHCEPLTLLEPLRQARIPVVVLEHDLPGFHCIAVDERQGGRLGAQHLIDHGHRRIGLIRRQPTSALSTHRLTGYQHALAAAGIPFDPALVVECGAGQAAGAKAMQQLLALADPPSAVFAHNDVLAMGAIHAVYAAGLSIPADISLVGYDDVTSAAYLVPALTTVRFPKAEMGVLAGRTILQLVQGKEELPAKTVTLPVELVVRASTAPPAFN